MADPIPNSWKELWNQWDVRWFIILSLSLQTFLILFSPLRKRVSRNWLLRPLWLSYLLADWAANFAVGLISNAQSSAHPKDKTVDLYAFWTPFLLVHLGGPDTITAFALEDNELWVRHLIGLFFQCVAALYIFLLSLTNDLWIPTMLMFVTGILKYGERTLSLYRASADSFKDSMLKDPDPVPNYASLMDDWFSKVGLHTTIEMLPELDLSLKDTSEAKDGDLTELEVVQYAYGFFKNFKGLVVDLIFSFRERNNSRAFFLKRTSEDAFNVLEAELNFIYEILFTKLIVVYSILGCLSRIISFASLFFSLGFFYFLEKKGKYSSTDVRITYSLLLAAITLDLTALLMLFFSDMTIVALRESPYNNANSRLSAFLNKFLKFRNGRSSPLEATQTNQRGLKCLVWPFRIFRRRWSESVGTYNLINYCLPHRSEHVASIFRYLRLTSFFDGIMYVKLEKFTLELRDFIFDELKAKSEIADLLKTAKEISSARGEWVLGVEEGWSKLSPFISEVSYDESLVLWHIATELCYNREIAEGVPDSKYRRISKLLSDYMIYLLVMQPNMMSAVAGIGLIRFRDTCAEAQKFFLSVKSKKEARKGANKEAEVGVNGKSKTKSKSQDEEQIEACMQILGVFTEVKPVTVKGDGSKSVLFDGCILAKEINKLAENYDRKTEKWKLMSKMWVELMSYAACHCRANTHAQQLSSGGELITFVWLLMAHFGLGVQLETYKGHPMAKLIIKN